MRWVETSGGPVKLAAIMPLVGLMACLAPEDNGETVMEDATPSG